MAQKVSEVCHEFSVWFQEYRVLYITFRTVTHFVLVFLYNFFFLPSVFLTHLWLLFLMTWSLNRKKGDLTWGPIEAWRLCRNCCVYVVYACVLCTSLLVCFHTRLPFTIRVLPLPPILPVCYLVTVIWSFQISPILSQVFIHHSV